MTDAVQSAGSSTDREVLVKVDAVSKKYCRDLKRSLWYGMQDIAATWFPRKPRNVRKPELRLNEFWALNDVSFELRRGECLGLVGRNGAGKSSLLKILNGLIKPDAGQVEINGRVAALIELGAGFHPVLTGRENVYVNGAVLGFSTAEIDEQMDGIIEFSELAEFMDTPVQNYSSGMKLRLGFAIAARLKPDVLLIDEVLAVGDVGFRTKCFNHLFEIGNDAAIIVVSHSMQQISRITSHMMILEHGRVSWHGAEIEAGIQHYFDQFPREKASRIGRGKVNVHAIEVASSGPDRSSPIPQVEYGKDMLITLTFSVDPDVTRFSIDLGFSDSEGRTVAKCYSRGSGVDFDNAPEPITIELRINAIPFAIGIYGINVTFTENTVQEHRGSFLAHYRAIAHFRAVSYAALPQAPVQLLGNWSCRK